jgi:hypothetical protein
MSRLARWHSVQLDGFGDLNIGRILFSNTTFGLSATTVSLAPVRIKNDKKKDAWHSLVTADKEKPQCL